MFDCSGRRVAARAVRRVGSDVDMLRVLPSCTLPTCDETGEVVCVCLFVCACVFAYTLHFPPTFSPSTGLPSRPNVLMFNDDGVVMHAIEQQAQQFRQWLRCMPQAAAVAVVEVGAGKAIPTIRRTSEDVLRAYPAATLVSVTCAACECDMCCGCA